MEERQISVTWYKPSGKFKYRGTATVKSYLFQDSYKQEIVDTQDAIGDGWQNDYFTVVVTAKDPEADAFDEAIFHEGSFRGIVKGGGQP